MIGFFYHIYCKNIIIVYFDFSLKSDILSLPLSPPPFPPLSELYFCGFCYK